jgi:hypothetical protein
MGAVFAGVGMVLAWLTHIIYLHHPTPNTPEQLYSKSTLPA